MKIFQKIFLSFFISLFLINIIPLQNVNADFTQLKPCKDSAVFQKRLNTSIKKLENRLKYYTPESKEYLFIQKEIQSTKNRFERYSNSSLVCGKEGLPRIIASGDLKHANEFIIPGLLFIYITGWIGWVGRKYLKYASTSENSFESEIIINIPIALKIMNSGFLWPIEVWKDFINSDLLASDNEITISPR